MKSPFLLSVAANLAKVEFFSPGACPGCPDCGLAPKQCRACDGCGTQTDAQNHVEWPCPDCDGTGEVECSEHDRECAEEGGFSWSACESCGSTFGGDRYPAHGFIGGTRYHFAICQDCVAYHANGDEPDEWYRSPREAREAVCP